MGKELTLEELANSAKKGSTKNEAPASVENTTETKPAEGKVGNSKTAKPISTSQLGAQLAAQHPEEVAAKHPVAEDSPLIKDAVDSMHKTIEERKARIEQAKPYIYENARQIAAENAEEASANGNAVNASRSSYDDDDDDEMSYGNRFDDSWGSEFDDDFDAAPASNNIDNSISVTLNTDLTNTKIQEPKPQEASEDKPLNSAAARMAAQIAENAANEVADDEDRKEVEAEAVTEPSKPEVVSSAPVSNAAPIPVTDDSDELAKVEDLDSLLQELGIDEDDDGDLVEEETQEEIYQKVTDTFKNVKVIHDPVNIGSFKIRSVPTSTSNVLNTINSRARKKTATWALYYTHKSVTFEECRGPELDNLYKSIQAGSAFSRVVMTLQFVYNHIVDANKPSFEQWAKMTRAEDVESLYFGLYRACYNDSNINPRQCPNESCKKVSMIDFDIDDMVEFEDDSVKDEFYRIMNNDSTTDDVAVTNSLIQISDDIIMSYSSPTVYSTYVQLAALNDKMIEDYNNIVNHIAYINGFFAIDRATNELIPMAVANYPNNMTKTVKAKLGAYIKVLKSLTNDQYSMLYAKLNALDTVKLKINYKYPACKCTECGAEIPGEDIDSCLNLLFSRAQLARMQNL